MRQNGAWLAIAILIVPVEARAEHRLALEPTVEVIEVHDDNLNFSADAPVRDQIRRITPALALRLDSPRWSARASYGIDSEQYASQSRLDNDRARERALIGIQYQAGPRLMLWMSGSYVNTNTLADLNVDTGLAASRVRGRQLSIGPSARFRISPRVIAVASASSITTNVEKGDGMRSQVQTLGIERSFTPRDVLTVNYEHSDISFEGRTPLTIHTHTILGGWSHDLDARTHLVLQAGPRITDGSPAVDASASLGRNWRFSSIAISLQRSQTTAVGYAGAVEMQSLQTKFTYVPSRKLTAYAAPALIRSTHHQLQGTVYRISLGARYTVTPLVDFDMAYNRDTQNGAIDPLRANARFSHATLSVGFSTRWNSADRYGTGQLR